MNEDLFYTIRYTIGLRPKIRTSRVLEVQKVPTGHEGGKGVKLNISTFVQGIHIKNVCSLGFARAKTRRGWVPHPPPPPSSRPI